MRDCVPELARPPWGRVGVVARTEVGGVPAEVTVAWYQTS